MLRQICVKGNVSLIFEEDFVDHKVSKPMKLLYSTDLVHLNMKGLSLWLRKVRAFLGLVTLLKRPGRQSAEEHGHYDNPGQHWAAYPLLQGIVLGNIFYLEIEADQHTRLLVESKKQLPLKV